MINSVIRRSFRIYYELLDWLILCLFTPFAPIKSKFWAYFWLSIFHYLHFFYYCNRQQIEKAKVNKETYRQEYAVLNPYLYDIICPRDVWLQGKKILDLGCYLGAKAEIYSKNGAQKVIGIDLAKNSIEIAKKYAHADLEFFCQSTHELLNNAYRGYFDTIVSFTVFEHIDASALAGVLDDCYNLLTDGGQLLIIYQHFDARFGAHLQDMCAFAYPEHIISSLHTRTWCNKRLKKMQAQGKYGCYVPSYPLNEGADTDSYLNINKLGISDFVRIIKASPFKNYQYQPYAQTCLMKFFAMFSQREIFRGSVIYRLKK